MDEQPRLGCLLLTSFLNHWSVSQPVNAIPHSRPCRNKNPRFLIINRNFADQAAQKYRRRTNNCWKPRKLMVALKPQTELISGRGAPRGPWSVNGCSSTIGKGVEQCCYSNYNGMRRVFFLTWHSEKSQSSSMSGPLGAWT